jgi:NAD(P)-dependent dehydrogenase (short-subunit alcohol dehydrogenase family)
MPSESAATAAAAAAAAATATTKSVANDWRSCFRPDLFRGRVALITGGGTGIGRAIATELAHLGATVVIASRNPTVCQRTAQEINETIMHESANNAENDRGRVIAGPATSIRKEDQIVRLIEFVIAECGALHLLVNNAGGQFISAAEDISKKGMQAVVETNLIGAFLMCREAYNQYMKDHPTERCAIVNITLGNRNGMPGMSHSGAARAGVENLTRTLSTEWMDVRINCVRPGIIWTDSGFANYGPAGDMFVDKILPTLPAKRFGSAQEVSSAVVWLLSEGASYVTGTVLSVDGASAFTFLPLVDIADEAHLLPEYGSLPSRAKL